ncbi:MAG TPA: LysR family transcriptional regulator [Xanthobacteraceae bacterium]|nr:LysR family transcriptional regulator [Xanthobacteraceae bacterium]
MATQPPRLSELALASLRLRDLQLLSAVVARKSMSKAAVDLRMSQASVSEALAKLEDLFGVKLLDRSSRGVAPTIYANVLLERGLVVFDELRQGMRDIQHLTNPSIGEVRVGCPETLAAGLLPAVIDRLSRQTPGIAVHIVHAESSTLEYRELRERNIDVMLGRVMDEWVGADDELDIEMLFDERYSVVAAKKNRWARAARVRLIDLVNDPWIHMPAHNPLASLLDSAFQAENLATPKASVTCFSMHVRMHLLATGRFLTIVPESMLRYNEHRWSIARLPIKLRIAPRRGAIVTLKGRTLSPVVKNFIAHVRIIAQELIEKS